MLVESSVAVRTVTPPTFRLTSIEPEDTVSSMRETPRPTAEPPKMASPVVYSVGPLVPWATTASTLRS